jgi:hypothetical protein
LGGFVFFDVAALNVVATSLWGGGPTLPLWGRVVTVDGIASVLSVGGGEGKWWGYGGGFVLIGFLMAGLYWWA